MQTELLKVSGMTYGGCVSNVTYALKALPGVGDVNVSLAAGEATVQYDEHRSTADQIKAAVRAAGDGVDRLIGNESHPSKGRCCG